MNEYIYACAIVRTTTSFLLFSLGTNGNQSISSPAFIQYTNIYKTKTMENKIKGMRQAPHLHTKKNNK